MDSRFVWRLLGEIFVSIALSIGVSLFVLPRFACLEVLDRASYSISYSHKTFELVILAMKSTHRSHTETYLCEADAIMKFVHENQSIIGTRAFQSTPEPPYVRKLFRSKQEYFRNKTEYELVIVSAQLMWHASAMIQAVHKISFNEYHADVYNVCGDSFTELLHALSALAEDLANDHTHIAKHNRMDAVKSATAQAFRSRSDGLVEADRLEELRNQDNL